MSTENITDHHTPSDPAVGSRDLLGQIASEILSALDNTPAHCWHEWDIFAGRMIYRKRPTPKAELIIEVLKRHWPNETGQARREGERT